MKNPLNLTPIDDAATPPRTLGTLAGIVWPADLLEEQWLRSEETVIR